MKRISEETLEKVASCSSAICTLTIIFNLALGLGLSWMFPLAFYGLSSTCNSVLKNRYKKVIKDAIEDLENLNND